MDGVSQQTTQKDTSAQALARSEEALITVKGIPTENSLVE